jgi:hypothetical protein
MIDTYIRPLIRGAIHTNLSFSISIVTSHTTTNQKMLCNLFAFAALAASTASALPQTGSGDPVDNGPISGPFLPNGTGPGECTSDYRLAGAQQVIFAYNLVQPGESAEAFQRLPLKDDCSIFMYVTPWHISVFSTKTRQQRQRSSRNPSRYR